MLRILLLVGMVGLSACKETKRPVGVDGAAEALRDNPPVPPPPPSLGDRADAGIPAAEVHPGPTRGADSPDALGAALVDAARRRDLRAFLDLTVSGRDIGLFFHAGLQASLRAQLAALAPKFGRMAQELPADATYSGIKRGLSIDFRSGQGAKASMPGLLGSELRLKAGGAVRSLSVARIVEIEGRWKVLEL
jgi:hypothetical protein